MAPPSDAPRSPPFAWMAAHGRWLVFLLVAAFGLAIDIGSKDAAFAHKVLAAGGKVPLIDGWLDLHLSVNRGAAFGLFWGKQSFFLLISGIAFVALVYFVHQSERTARLGPAVLGLVFAGVGGNFWDRCVHVLPDGNTSVRDFIYAHTPETGRAHDFCVRVFGSSQWPTFNAADIFICVGAGAIVIALWREDRLRAEREATTPPPTPAPPAAAPAPAPEAA